MFYSIINNNKMNNTKYIVYSSWETKMPNGGSVCGSLYLDYHPDTEDKAKEAVEDARKKSEEFHKKFPSKGTKYQYGYHLINNF